MQIRQVHLLPMNGKFHPTMVENTIGIQVKDLMDIRVEMWLQLRIKMPPKDQNDSTLSRMFVLHRKNPDFIPITHYGPLNTIKSNLWAQNQSKPEFLDVAPKSNQNISQNSTMIIKKLRAFPCIQQTLVCSQQHIYPPNYQRSLLSTVFEYSKYDTISFSKGKTSSKKKVT